ncbi:MAG TPA: c-type cytochrome [Gemmatimonadaceae bacterium]|jgi:mono/diheme cytochrome c family protein/glucose/arabinose dehydrogenase|nr:c-type cytochrome [Gemmatimonadaceae bacterium]
MQQILSPCQMPPRFPTLVSLAAAAWGILMLADRPATAPTGSLPATPPFVRPDSPPAQSPVAPVLTPQEELTRFHLPPGYRAELVAAEPLVTDPVAIDFDPDGRMYVVEMRGFMRNLSATGEKLPVGRVVVLEDTDGDGRMDKQTVFLDSLVLPRAVKVLEHGVLVGAPPDLWLARDTTGDLRADTRVRVRDDYGPANGNPEHNANGLLWGIDNWIHNANYPGEFRIDADGKIAYRQTPDEGQWGVSMDDFGRLFRNSNEDPLHADLVPAHYAMRNPHLANMRGVYERLTPNVAVWPGHKTPAVNRGYRIGETLRPDSTLAHYTSAGSPTAFVGDRLPDELHHSVLVTESAGNLIGRFIVEDSPDGAVTAKPAYDRAEFMTGSDERFRPVNLATGPDGALYVVDMYRGIIEHRAYITGYLEQKIVERGLEGPVGFGRIWRIVHTSMPRGESPHLSTKSPAELVPLLAHPNGWWRVTAQRLLVERGAQSVAPALRAMLRDNADARARLHALWTLDGLGEADTSSVRVALADSSPHVRAAAIRVAEPHLARAGDALQPIVLALLSDRSPTVRRQLAASLGELPLAVRDSALLDVVVRYGDDPVVADLVVSALFDRELPFLERALATKGSARDTIVRALAAAITASHNASAIERVLELAGSASRPRATRLALLAGIQLPRTATVIELRSKPTALIRAATGADPRLRGEARRVTSLVSWPGKPNTTEPPRPLTPAERARYAAGQKQFLVTCAPCHQPNGMGRAGVAKPLVGSLWATGPTARAVRIVLQGKEGQMLMPPAGSTLSDEQIAATLTFVRRSWGNAASPVSPAEVKEARGATAGRSKPWTEAELSRIRGEGPGFTVPRPRE